MGRSGVPSKINIGFSPGMEKESNVMRTLFERPNSQERNSFKFMCIWLVIKISHLVVILSFLFIRLILGLATTSG